MCGIAGYLGHSTDPPGILQRMADALRHRGPDDGGIWFDGERGIGFAHRRLAILDLSAEGHQPMHAASGRYVIVFNGEVYNFLELQKELAALGHRFRGHSDTEVMLAAFDEWGVAGSLKRFAGMFALALWDRAEATLYLARDRAGEKPLYYGWQGNSFLFGSELKALRRHPDWTGGVDPEALRLFFRHTYLPAPLSIHPGIKKLEPGSYLKLGPGQGREPELVRYWSVRQVARTGQADPFAGSDAEALEVLEATLGRAVSRQMISDVPLGAFLSGGYDSSTIVALMQELSPRPVKTFSIGFHEKAFDEAGHAREVARHLGTEHTELYVTERDCLEVIPQLPELYDEPFADSSQIPSYLLARLARREVTVALSGDAGDELFCGYNRYDLVKRHWDRMALLPHALRRGMRSFVDRMPDPVLDAACSLAGRGTAGTALHPARLKRLAQLFAAGSPGELGEMFLSYDTWADALMPGGVQQSAAPGAARSDCIATRMMLDDFESYLPDDILVKVDRAAMGVSLETRIPLLDPELIELVWRFPMHLKVRGGERKWLLRQLLYRRVPRELLERPKMGFGVPVDLWIRGPLREWAEELLSERALAASGLFAVAPVRRSWQEHLVGRGNWKYELWSVLMLQAWLGQNR